MGAFRLPVTRLVLVTLAATAAVACSSESSTAPTRAARLALVASLDSARNASTTGRANILWWALTQLGAGAPVDSITIELNGKAETYQAVATYMVQFVNGVPSDSAYEIIAWDGDPLDSIYALYRHQTSVNVAFWGRTSEGETQPDSAAAQVAALHPNQTCGALHTHLPPDVELYPGLSCQRERVSATFTGSMPTSDGGFQTVTLPQQSLPSTRLVANGEDLFEF